MNRSFQGLAGHITTLEAYPRSLSWNSIYSAYLALSSVAKELSMLWIKPLFVWNIRFFYSLQIGAG